MKPLIFLSALLFIFTLSACNKDDNNNGHPNLDYSVSDLTNDTLFFDYDNHGDLNVFEDSGDSTYYTINGNLLHFINYKKSEKRTIADATFTLNSDGNIISGHGNFSYTLANPFSSDYTFTYDNAGNLTNINEVRSDGSYYEDAFVWINGDIIYINYINNGSTYYTRTLTYDLTKEDKIKINKESFLMPMNSHIGNMSRHLEQHEYSIYPPNTMGQYIYDFTYTLDQDGFPTLLSIFETDNSSTEVITYHYK